MSESRFTDVRGTVIAVVIALAILVAVPVVVLGGARLVSAHGNPESAHGFSCSSGKALLQDYSVEAGLTDDEVRSAFEFVAPSSEVPEDVRPAFEAYYGENRTLLSARAVEWWFQTCRTS